MPRVSVVIPTYNAAPFICQAVTSALGQTLRDLEVIVVDDGSSDCTLEVLHGFDDVRLRVVSQEHGERSAARNRGIRMAGGEYVAFLDADDWWHPAKLARQLAVFDRNASLGASYCWLQQVGPHGGHLRILRGVQTSGHPDGATVFDELLFGNIGGPGSSLVVTRELLDIVGGFKPGIAYGEDWDFCLRIAHHGQIGYVPEPLVFYRAHGVYVPAKMNRLGMQEAGVAVVRDALALRGIPETRTLARQALAQAFWLGGLVDAGVGDYESASQRLARAIELDRSQVESAESTMVKTIAHYANGLYDTTTQLGEALLYVTSLLDCLRGPAQVLKQYRSRILALTSAIQVFDEVVCRDRERLRRAFWTCLRYNPRWLRNGGFVKRGVEAHLPAGNLTRLAGHL